MGRKRAFASAISGVVIISALATAVRAYTQGSMFTYDATVYQYDEFGVAIGAQNVEGDYDTAAEAKAACEEARDNDICQCESEGGVSTVDASNTFDNDCNGFAGYYSTTYSEFQAPGYQYQRECSPAPTGTAAAQEWDSDGDAISEE